jgi:branched-chain amino acid transport system permease protein
MSRNWQKKSTISLLIGLLLFLVPAFVKSSYILHVFVLIYLAIIYTVSLRLVLANGLLSFGHGAFAGIGAYASALLMMKVGLPFLLSMIIAATLSALVGGLIAFPSLRVRGAYFVIFSWAFGEVFVIMYKRLKGIFGGASGLYGIPGPSLFGMTFTSKLAYFYLALALMLITVAVCYRIETSRFGMIIKSIGNSEDLAESVGINLPRYKVLNFSLACFFAGIAGTFLAHYTHFLSPEMFGIGLSESIVVFMLVGGGGNILGAIIGATILTAIPEILAFTSFYRMIVYGAILILTIIFLPGGLVSLPQLVRKRGAPGQAPPSRVT